MSNRQAYVLDSFALLAHFQDEPGAAAVQDILRLGEQGDADLFMTVVNVGEVVYRTIRKYDADRAHDTLTRIDDSPIQVFSVERDLALAAASLKGRIPVSYADCLAAALGRALDAPVVTGDPDFKLLEGEVDIEWLAGSG